MPDKTELLACPFCGSEGEMQEQSQCFGYCSHCDAAGGYGDTPEEAARLWNTRAIPSPPVGERAKPHGEEVAVILHIDGRSRDIDASIAPIVAALNAAGVTTKASCSGHSHRPGNIALRDGRELIIARDFVEARKIDRLFPLDINGRLAAPDAGITRIPDTHGRQSACAASISLRSMGEGTYLRRAGRITRLGLPLDACAKDAGFLVDGQPCCAHHAGEAALAKVLTTPAPVGEVAVER